jgi:hypothetical protein
MKRPLNKDITLTDFVVRVYINDKFSGYLKEYRLHRNKKYRFNKTKNINNAIKFLNPIHCGEVIDRIIDTIDKLHHINKVELKCIRVTEQELRKSKLYLLNTIIEREGIFKRVKHEN